MSIVIVDSSVFLADYLGEEFAEQSEGLMDKIAEEETELHAPWLLAYEVINAFRNAVARGRLDAATARRSINSFFLLPIELHADRALAQRAYDIAAAYNLAQAYDAQYLALAERLECPFWTADRKLYNAVTSKVHSVHWIGNYRQRSPSSYSG